MRKPIEDLERDLRVAERKFEGVLSAQEHMRRPGNRSHLVSSARRAIEGALEAAFEQTENWRQVKFQDAMSGIETFLADRASLRQITKRALEYYAKVFTRLHIRRALEEVQKAQSRCIKARNGETVNVEDLDLDSPPDLDGEDLRNLL